jgi:hypothetical protein
MTIKRLGATKKYADNWESIFGGGKKKAGKVRPTTKSPKRKVAKKAKPAKAAGRKKAKK